MRVLLILVVGEQSVDSVAKACRIGVWVGGDDRVPAGGGVVRPPDYADPRGRRRCRGWGGGQQGTRARIARANVWDPLREKWVSIGSAALVRSGESSPC